MNQVRVLLAGECSGLREVIKNAVVAYADLKLIEIQPKRLVSENVIRSTVKSDDVNVVILDLDDTDSGSRNVLCSSLENQSSIAEGLSVKYPELIVVELKSLGKKMVMQSLIHMTNLGLNQFIRTIIVASESR